MPAAAPAQSLVGRDQDIRELTATLDGSNGLVTLTGPGGVGKTRLALAAADVVRDRYPDGVHLVELAPVKADQVVNAMASSVDAREAIGLDLEGSIADHLAGRRVLLVLDNCEHVVDAAAQIAHALLRRSTELSILATSQVPLGTSDETVYVVDPLAVPNGHGDVAQSPAVQLFVDRARRSKRSFDLTEEAAAAVAQICRQLDGMPLAIELAAARVRALSPTQIADRLDDRFHLLTSGNRTDAERHQTLRAAMEWSYSLLEEPERRVLSRVASFPGGFDLEAAEQVASDDRPDGVRQDDVLDVVATLVDRSLVTTIDRDDGSVRYRLLETIRTYALEQLDDDDFDRATDRMLRWAVGLAEAVEDEIDGPGEDEAFVQVSVEQENLLAAIGLAEDAGDAAAALTIAAVLAVWLDIVGQFGEGIAMCEDVLAWTTDVDPTARRRLLLRAGNLALSSGALDQAHRFYEESLDRARELDDPQGVLSAINNLSITAMWQGNFGLAASLLAEADPSEDTAPGSLAILKVTSAQLALNTNRLDDVIRITDEVSAASDEVGSYTMAEAEVLRASALLASNRLDDAQLTFELAIEHADAADAMEFRALARHGLAVVALERDDLDTARSHLDTALDEARAADHSRALAQLLATAGRAAWAGGDLDGARSRQAEARQLRIRMGDRHGIAQGLEAEAALVLEQHPGQATRLLGAASALREQAGGPPWPIEQERLDAALAALRASADYDRLWAAGVAAADPEASLADLVATLDQPA